MNRLFVRIWLANWLVFVLVVFATAYVFQQLRVRELRSQFASPSVHPPQLKQSFEQAIATGEKPEDWALRMSKEKQQVFLLGPDGKDLAGRPLPEPLLPRNAPTFFRHLGPESPGESIRLAGYPPLQLLAFRRPPGGPLHVLSPVFLVGLAFLASGLAAVVLARYISLPIKQLHLASDRVASGDFQTNVAASVGHRKDEIADLARRFDLMAKALDTANKNQQDLLRDVSHELRSPLTRLLLISDLLANTQGEEQKKLQVRLKKDLGDLETLVDEVMTLARFEVESGTLHLEKKDLVTILDPLIEDACFEANAVNKTVTFLHAAKSLPVNVAPVHICRAVENIVRNAIRHTRDNTEVLVELTQEGSDVVLKISDCGDGVEDAELNKIFSPFYRSASARAKFKGAGIGLALAERIIKSHKGEISARNLPAGGLQVRIVLPLA